MANADVAWVDVLPTIKSFIPELRKQLGTALPAAGRQAGADFGSGFTVAAVSGVEQASAKLAAARKKEADAAGAQRVAQVRLQELIDSGKAKTSQLASANESLAKATRNVERAQDETTRATKGLEQAQEQQARATKEGADGLDRINRQGGLVTRTFGGMRNAVATGFAAFYAAQGVTRFLGSAITAASNLNETVNKSNQIFGRNADEVDRWARGAAKSVGLSRQAALDAAAGFGNMLTQLGFAGDEAAKLSTQIVQTAADLGSFNNLDTDDVAERIGAAFRGEYDSLQLLIPNISAARVETEALSLSGKKNADQLTAQEKATAVLSIIQKDGAKAAGDFARTADGLANSQKTLTAEWEDAKARLGELLTGPMTGVVRFLINGVVPAFESAVGVVGAVGEAIGSLPSPVQAALGALLLVRIGIALLNGPLSGVKEGFIGLGSTIRTEMVTAARTTTASTGIIAAGASVARAGWAGFRALLGGPVGLAIAGVTLLISLLSDKTDDNTESTEKATRAQGELAQALLASKGAIDSNVRAAAAKEAQDRGILEAAEAAGIPLSKVTDAILGQGNAYAEVAAALQAYLDKHTFLTNAAGAEDAARASTAAHTGAVREGLAALNELAGQTEGNIASARQLAEATDGEAASMGAAAPAAADLTTQLEGARDAANQAKQATDLLKFSLDVLTGAHVDLSQAEAAFYDAMAQADGALKDLNGTVLDGAGNLNTQSEAGRRAQEVLFGVRDSGNELIATMIQQGATADQVLAKDAQLREGFIKTAMQMGISREAAETLANQIYGIPSERKTQITADTSQATQAAAALQQQIDNLHGRTVDIIARAVMPDLNGSVSGSGRPGLAFGGEVPGSSPHDRADNVPIMATAGEFMQPRPSVRKYGLGFMESVRSGRFPVELARGYADGGPIAPVTIAAELDAGVYQRSINTAAQRVLDFYEPVQGFIRALQWARTQVGKPYIWGGVGPGGYDCSGFMSAVTNVIRGRSPYSRVGSTATFPWPGFAPGSGLYTIGSTPNAGGGIGHMAGTLLGVNVESTGGVGVRVGPSARGAGDGLFSERGHLVFDTGGLWPPGWGFNGTGDVERVLTPPQDDYFRRFVDVAERAGGASLIDTVNLYAQDNAGIYRAFSELNHQLRVRELGGAYAGAF